MRSLVVLALGLVLGAQALEVEIPLSAIPVGCSAALKCTPIEFCTAKGMISTTSVSLTREQALYRVPLTDCRDAETGVLGKCCRDPYYTDPWPTNQIGKWVPGVFGGNDGKYTTTEKTGEIIKDETLTTAKPTAAAIQIGVGQIAIEEKGEIAQVAQVEEGQVGQYGIGQIVIPGEEKQYIKEGQTIVVEQGGEAQALQFGIGQYEIGGETKQIVKPGETIVVEQGGGGLYLQGGIGQQIIQGFGTAYSQKLYRIFLQPYEASATCGLFHNQRPYGDHLNLEADFAQYPWQAMVLEKSNKSLLCGGVITRPDVVLTSASCVDKFAAESILIKGGEWKLGVDEEPLPFQIVQVKHVLFHPFYESGTFQFDVAILVLEENLRFANNIYPICLPSAEESFEALFAQSYGFGYGSAYGAAYGSAYGSCVVTGWGKEVLQAHRLGSIMHDLNVTLVNPDECSAKINKYYPEYLPYFNKDSSACAAPVDPLQNICSVDIGSALACPTKDGQYVLRGIYSFDTGCSVLGNQIGAFYKFDLEWYQWAIGLIESIRFASFSKGALLAGAEGKIKVEGEALGIKQEGIEFGQAGLGLLGGQSIIYQTKPQIVTYTTKPEIITYTTKPKIITYTTKPEIITYTTKPKIITYTTKPEIITYTTKPEILTYTTKPEVYSYVSNPQVISYASEPVAAEVSAAVSAEGSFIPE